MNMLKSKDAPILIATAMDDENVRAELCVRNYDFIPIVELDKTYPENEFTYLNNKQYISLSPYIEKKMYPLEIVKLNGKIEVILRFTILQGNSAANDKQGNIRIVGNGVKIITKDEINVKYGYKILLKISGEGLKKDACIDFYANDDDNWFYSASNVHCGRIAIEVVKASKGYYYASNGTLLGRIGSDEDPTDVMLVEDSLKDKAKELISKINNEIYEDAELIKASSAVGMKNEELNLRAFLTVVRQAEAGGTKGRTEVAEPLAYNIRYGNFVFYDYSKHPNILYSGHGYSIPSTAAGAYQFIYRDWIRIVKPLGFNDFSPENQDKGALQLIKWQEEYNSKAKGVIRDIESGNIESAAVKLNGTWPSLPDGSQEKIGLKDVKEVFVKNIAKELKDDSAIKSKKGTFSFN